MNKTACDIKRRSARHNIFQKRFLIDYMQRHPSLAAGMSRKFSDRELYDRLWEKLAIKMNERGPPKSVGQWKKAWKDLKCRTRIKAVSLRRAKSKQTNVSSVEFTPTDLNVISILKSALEKKYETCDPLSEDLVSMTDMSNGDSFTMTVIDEENCDAIPKETENVNLNSYKNQQLPKSRDIRRRGARHNLLQKRYLIDYMQKHVQFAVGNLKYYSNREVIDTMWDELATRMNEIGPPRSTAQWKKVWKDLKARARAKSLAIRRARMNMEDNQVQLTQLEKTVLSIIRSGAAFSKRELPENNSPELQDEMEKSAIGNFDPLSEVEEKYRCYVSVEPVQEIINDVDNVMIQDVQKTESPDTFKETFLQEQESEEPELVSCIPDAAPHVIEVECTCSAVKNAGGESDQPCIAHGEIGHQNEREVAEETRQDLPNYIIDIQRQQTTILETLAKAMLILAENKAANIQLQKEMLLIEKEKLKIEQEKLELKKLIYKQS